MKKSDVVQELVKNGSGVQSSVYRWVESGLYDEKIREENGMLEAVK
jgi:hypothetical protein